jgi:hypothetical protein
MIRAVFEEPGENGGSQAIKLAVENPIRAIEEFKH